jgi:hypothetical protein
LEPFAPNRDEPEFYLETTGRKELSSCEVHPRHLGELRQALQIGSEPTRKRCEGEFWFNRNGPPSFGIVDSKPLSYSVSLLESHVSVDYKGVAVQRARKARIANLSGERLGKPVSHRPNIDKVLYTKNHQRSMRNEEE